MSEAVIESNVEPTEWFGGHRTCLWGCAAVSLVLIGLRMYQGEYALTYGICLLYTSPSPRDRTSSRMPSSA